jgi:hypothetical protein
MNLQQPKLVTPVIPTIHPDDLFRYSIPIADHSIYKSTTALALKAFRILIAIPSKLNNIQKNLASTHPSSPTLYLVLFNHFTILLPLRHLLRATHKPSTQPKNRLSRNPKATPIPPRPPLLQPQESRCLSQTTTPTYAKPSHPSKKT